MHIHSFLWGLRLLACDIVSLYVCGMLSARLCGYSEGLDNFTFIGLCLVAVTCFMALSVVGGYESRSKMNTLRYTSEHALTMGAALVAAFVLTYVFSSYHSEVKPGRSVLFLGLLMFTPVSWGYRYFLARAKLKTAAARHIYVVGSTKLAAILSKICRGAHFPHPLRFIELTEGPILQSLDSSSPSKWGIRSLGAILNGEKSQCEAIVVDVSRYGLDPGLQELFLKINLHAVSVYPVESFIEFYFHKIPLSHVNLTLAFNGTFKAAHHSVYGHVKVLLDFTISAMLFIVLMPVMLMVALIIKFDDGGPVLFTQPRMGRFERPFTIYKFRSMRLSLGEKGGDYTARGDQRITRVGRILRLTRLDELPQLWNVIKGDMSLIGPRAEWCKLVEQYEKKIPLYHLRHMVKPGITGWAQVNYGYGGDLQDTREKLQYDLYYIKYYSGQMDAAIILKTIFTILSAAGR